MVRRDLAGSAFRRLACLLVVACFAAGAGPGAAASADDASLELVLEPLAERPYEQEMLLVTVRGFYRGTIAHEHLEQPRSSDFSWMQLDDNRWSDAHARGRQARSFERRIAVFPQRSGRLEIPSFVHHLTLIDAQGRRYEQSVRSAPLVIDVQPRLPDPDWWLPARALHMTEEWDRPPEGLGLGELAHRSITLEAEGIGPEQLPPTPALRSSGLVTFADPEERSVRLTPDGPVSSVTWHWTVKPVSDAIGVIEPVTIPWFDTQARVERKAVVPAAQVGLATARPTAGPRSLADRVVMPAGLLGGFACGLVLLLPGLRLRGRAEFARLVGRFGLKPDRSASALRRAAARGDAGAMRSAASRLFRAHRSRGGSGSSPNASTVERELSRLDRYLFGPPDGRRELDLRALARNLLRARRSSG